MRMLLAFGAFWYDFIVGDDWTIAVAVVIALALTAMIVRAGINAWWLLPLVVVLFLGVSLLRVARSKP